MTIILKLVIVVITVFAFSCKQPSAKKEVLQNANSKTYLNTENASATAILAATDTVTAKQNKTTAIKPYCCKGAPSRFSFRAKK